MAGAAGIFRCTKTKKKHFTYNQFFAPREGFKLGLQRDGTFTETFQKSLEDSKKSCKVSKISAMFPKFTGHFQPFCNPN